MNNRSHYSLLIGLPSSDTEWIEFLIVSPLKIMFKYLITYSVFRSDSINSGFFEKHDPENFCDSRGLATCESDALFQTAQKVDANCDWD